MMFLKNKKKQQLGLIVDAVSSERLSLWTGFTDIKFSPWLRCILTAETPLITFKYVT